MRDDENPSPRVLFVDWEKTSIEELKELKMSKGGEKYGDPKNYHMVAMLMRFNRHIGEFLLHSEYIDPSAMLEAIADIANVGELLFPKLQELYTEQKENAPSSGPGDNQDDLIALLGRDEESTRFE